MTVTIEKNELVLRVPLNDSPSPSKSGKTLIVASSHGIVQTAVQVDGKTVQVGFNAFVAK